MGGHGGLNILPQKRWNVYNYENREKVRRDEEAAAKEEQLKREQVRKRDAEFRLEQLRTARGLAPLTGADDEPAGADDEPAELEEKPGHINLFDGIKIFDPIKGLENEQDVERDSGHEKKKKKMKKEEVQKKVVTAEDEKYRLGYGVAGKGVKLPWYLHRLSDNVDAEGNDGSSSGVHENARKSGKKTLEELREERLRREQKEKENAKKSGKKTLEELREERLRREEKEKDREKALMVEKHRRLGTASRNRGFSRR